MSKRLEERVHVFADARGRPLRVRRGRRQIQVRQIVDEWEEASRWWQGEKAIRVYRVLTSEEAVWELHHQGADDWRLYRIHD
jgi:hypothetical protein